MSGYKLADGTYSSDYKIGDKFEVVSDSHYCFSKGAIITLTEDGGSKNPYFEDNECVNWDKLKFYKPAPEMSSKQFTKSNLLDGMVCTIRCGYTYTVQGDRLVGGVGCYIRLNDLREDLTVDGGTGDLDIVQVVQPTVLFTRQEVPAKSPAQIELDKLHEQIAALQQQADKLQQSL